MMMSSYLLFFSTDFVGCNLIRSLFYFAWREKEKSSKKKIASDKAVINRWWCWNDAYVMFIRNSPLLDILHCDFLYRAPWHDPLLLHPRFKRKITRKNFLQGSTSDQTRLRKFARRRFFVIRLVQMRKIPSTVTRSSDFAPADFLSNIRPLGSRQELIVSQFFRPTKLPAYPGSPTPIQRAGLRDGPALKRQCEPQAQPSVSFFHFKL